jgi:predicted acylesterase/phospholipase RssA
MNQLQNSAEAALGPEITSIDLALSGGGFRATLFHLGLIGFLRDRGLLKKVKNICSVSGGSILAAHVITYWKDYSGDDDEVFQTRVRHLVKTLMTRDMSGNVLSESKERILSFRPLATERLVTEYRQMLESDTCKIRRWDQLRGDVPRLHILATHLNTGRAGAYSNDYKKSPPLARFHIPRVDPHQRHAAEINALAGLAEAITLNSQDIAWAVAASSAFPPVFSPIPVTEGATIHLLTDGGVYDNSGVKYLEYLYETEDNGSWKGARDRMVFMSDAGRDFPTALVPQYGTFLALAMRVTDTQGDRIANIDSMAVKNFFDSHGITVIRMSIHNVIRSFPKLPDSHSVPVQLLLGMIRTELDKFSAEEVFALYRHGYFVAQQEYAGRMRAATVLTDEPWTPVPLTPTDEDLKRLTAQDLERRLTGADIIKKQDAFAGTLRKWIKEWVLRKYRWQIIIFAALLAFIGAFLFVIGYRAGEPPGTPPPVNSSGLLTIGEAVTFKHDSWAARLPALAPSLRSTEPQYLYTIATDAIGNLTRGRPHTATFARFRLTGELADSQIYLFLRQKASSDGFRYVALEEAAPRKLIVAAGEASDVLCGVVVSKSEIAMPDLILKNNIKITLEETP